MDWTETITQVIDMRSFSNLWFWIALAVVWSSVSHWVLGVPYDMVARARRHGGRAEADLEDIVRINVSRLVYIGRVSGLLLIGFICFLLTGLAILAFWYDVEIAQALFLILFPMTIVGALSLSRARTIAAEAPTGEELRRHLARHRLWTQMIGMVSIFVTAMYGMYQNLVVGPGF